jgi:hypothetical protein
MTPVIIIVEQQGYTLAPKKGCRHMCLRSRTYQYIINVRAPSVETLPHQLPSRLADKGIMDTWHPMTRHPGVDLPAYAAPAEERA